MSLSSETIKTIKATAPILEIHGATITTVFYKNMFINYPELLNLFNEVNQRRGWQQQALANMVYIAAKNIDQLATLLEKVKLVAHKHRGLGVKPEHYPIVGKYLLLGIKEVLGDAATEEIMNAWEETYNVIAQVFIDVEKELYQEAKEQPGGWDGFKDFIVTDKVKESDIITSFYLKSKDNKPLADYKPGQYLTIRVTMPDEKYMQIRHYTISAAPGADTYRISVKRENDYTPDGKVSNYLHGLVDIGDTLEASAPAGIFVLEENNRPVTLISGGVGITPMVSMLETLASKQSNKKINFLHAARNESVHAFHNHVRELIFALPHAAYTHGYSESSASNKADFKGYITKEILEKIITQDTVCYIVGPVPFMKHVTNLLREIDLNEADIRFELFGPAQNILEEVAPV